MPNGNVIGALGADESTTILYKVGNWMHDVYTTSKGEFTKSGYMKL